MKSYTIIGIDGGASKVSAWHIIQKTNTGIFSLGENHAEKKYSDIPGWIADFKPVDIKRQLSEKDSSKISPTTDEQQQATVYVEACALAIEEIVEKTENKNVLIGLGMPGLKTTDKRGIELVANGPRMIGYSDILENRLRSVNITPIVPIYQLGSDADYCGIGENYANDGAFVSCKNAYYLGGGTGVADALKLKGKLVPLDATKNWMAKTWELKSANGKSLERFCSANGIQSIYAELSDTKQTVLNEKEIYPPQIADRANDGDKAAIETFIVLSDYLAQLIFSRITTLAYGWQKDFEFVNPTKPALSQSHDYLDSVFEKIILGQRLGDLYSSVRAKTILKKALLEKLINLIKTNNMLNPKIKAHYSMLDKIITVSKLREAPALGAGIDAFLNYQKYQ